MKILYDHQIFSRQKFGGISRYFCEIINHLPPQIERDISINYSDNIYLRQLNFIKDIKPLFDPRFEFLNGVEFKGKGRLFQIAKTLNPQKYLNCEELNRCNSINYLKRQDFDVFHPTYYDDYFLNYIGDKPFVLTIHDMNHELFPEFYSSSDELNFVKVKAKLSNQAAHIIAVSENTKRDIIEVLGIKPEKISVIYHGTSIINEGKEFLGLPEKYLLYVGDRAPEYKNFKFMARALASIMLENEKLFVVCTGREFDKKEINFFTHLGLSERFISKFIPDNLFYSIYSGSIALIFPSLYEGFGIPILEAFQCNCPVILANSSCFPEIVKDAALLFEPKNLGSLRDQVKNILYNRQTRNYLIQKGQDRVKEFSWVLSAQKTLEVYNSVK